MASFIDKELFERAVRLHGHLESFLVLGLKMGLRAKKILGEKPEICEVGAINCKPNLCAVDGVKAVMRSNLVTVREDEGCLPSLAELMVKRLS